MVPEESDLKDVLTPGTLTSRFVLEGISLAIELCQPYPSSKGTIFEAVCQTLVAGKDHSSRALLCCLSRLLSIKLTTSVIEPYFNSHS